MKPGFFVVFDEPKLAEQILGSLRSDPQFTFTVSQTDWGVRQRDIYLVSYDGAALHGVGLGVGGARVATGRRRVAIRRFHQFPKPIPLVELDREVSARLRTHLLRTS